MDQSPQLYVLVYHYIRDLPRTRFPRIKGMLLEDFRHQVKSLADRFEPATLKSAMDFLKGKYLPRRNLCLLTFDDGLKEHYADITPILVEYGIQGTFFVISSCLEEGVVAPVHMNHFLMAELGFEQYRADFLDAVGALWTGESTEAGSYSTVACRTYPLDTTEVAEFKYLFNFILSPEVRDLVVKRLFEAYIGPERVFAAELYLSWAQAQEMQTAGMLIGGHTDGHRPLACLNERELDQDLKQCRALMDRNLSSQEQWPFSYPYGKRDSFSEYVVKMLQKLGFCCSFSTESGPNLPGIDPFAIRRLDGKNLSTGNQPKTALLEKSNSVALPSLASSQQT